MGGLGSPNASQPGWGSEGCGKLLPMDYHVGLSLPTMHKDHFPSSREHKQANDAGDSLIHPVFPVLEYYIIKATF